MILVNWFGLVISKIKSVAGKQTSVSELRKGIMRTLKHSSSTDDHPQHDDCPTGKNGWCFYQQALSYEKGPPIHLGKSSCFSSPQVALAIKPVYERLTADSLLSRCLRGMTQNANESFHSQVWMRCPNHLFTSRRCIEIALTTAVANFNSWSPLSPVRDRVSH